MSGPPPGHHEFVRAVLLSFDPTSDPAMRSAANASLTALRQAEDGWQFCLQGFCAAHEEPVKFWCLQTVVDSVSKQRRYASLPDMQKQSVRAVLMQWLQSKGGPQTDEPVSVKNKFAQLLVAILRVDYPQCWPMVFDQMLATLQVCTAAAAAAANANANATAAATAAATASESTTGSTLARPRGCSPCPQGHFANCCCSRLPDAAPPPAHSSLKSAATPRCLLCFKEFFCPAAPTHR